MLSSSFTSKFKKLCLFFLLTFSLLFLKPLYLISISLKTLIRYLSFAMDDTFDLDDFPTVESSTFNFDNDDDDDILFSNTNLRRRRRRISPSSSLRYDRVFLVCYKWWNDASKSECLGEEKGVFYAAASPSSDDDDGGGSKEEECGTCTDDEIVLNFRREGDDEDDKDKGEGFSGREYALISESMWFKALKWHSDYWTRIKDVGCSLTAENGNQDVFPIHLRLFVMRETNLLAVKISLMDNPVELYKRACQIFNVQFDSVCIRDFSGQMTRFLEGDAALPPSDCLGQDPQEVLLELQVYGLPKHGKDTQSRKLEIAMQGRSNSGGPCSSYSTKMNGIAENHNSYLPFLSSYSCTQGYRETGVLGLTGLLNLGNTCFMNSAIQCLAHTSKLVDFFLGDYKKEINYENPLGMNGELALAFGDLLRKLWAPSGMPIAPRLFKSTLESFAPQFCGYNQHDSQELLAFLLDGLHEDLNRVKNKPYVQVGNTEGCPDDDVAEEFWQCYLARNDSIIVDLFHGQFQSTLVCPICKNASVTFDPFMYLSLPLPSATMRTMTVTLLSSNNEHMLSSPLTVTVPKYGSCKDLIQALSMASTLRDDETLFVAEVYNHRILCSLEDPCDSLALIRDDDCLVAYQIPKEKESSLLVIFMHQRSERHPGFRMTRPCWSLFGIPLVVRISSLSRGSQIHEEYMKLLRPFLNTVENDNTEKSDKDLAKIESRSSSNSDNSWSSDDEMGAQLHGASDFQFHFTDERGMVMGQRIKLGEPLDVSGETKKINVLVNWSEKMWRLYEISHLNLLPEVFRSGFLAIKPQESVSLYKCLEGFLKEEPLGPEDMWFCPSCKEHRQASKKLDLWRLPEILVVHLKRFSYSRFLNNKLDTYVDFPMDQLDLTGFLARESDQSANCYRLYAISNHYGSMGGGHYTALAYHGKRWYEFNDNVVESVDEEEIKTSAAYVLFYRRISDT